MCSNEHFKKLPLAIVRPGHREGGEAESLLGGSCTYLAKLMA